MATYIEIPIEEIEVKLESIDSFVPPDFGENQTVKLKPTKSRYAILEGLNRILALIVTGEATVWAQVIVDEIR